MFRVTRGTGNSRKQQGGPVTMSWWFSLSKHQLKDIRAPLVPNFNSWESARPPRCRVFVTARSELEPINTRDYFRVVLPGKEWRSYPFPPKTTFFVQCERGFWGVGVRFCPGYGLYTRLSRVTHFLRILLLLCSVALNQHVSQGRCCIYKGCWRDCFLQAICSHSCICM